MRNVAGVTRRDHIRNTYIREALKIEPVTLFVERSQLRWLGHVLRMSEDGLPKRVLEASLEGRRPVGRPRQRWEKQAEELCKTKLWLEWDEVLETAQDRPLWRRYLDAMNPQP